MWRSEARRLMTSSSTSAKSSSISPIAPSVWASNPSIGRSAGSCYAGDLGHGRQSGLDLVEPVVAELAHALAHGDGGELISRRALQRKGPEVVGDRHHLVE